MSTPTSTERADSTPSGGGGWPVLHPTTQAAYNAILWRGGLPRIEIARLLGVSRTRLTAITRDLEAVDLVYEGGREQRSSTGRPAEMLYARPDRFHFMGVTARWNTLVAAAVDLTNRVVWERAVELPDPTVDRIADYAQTWLAEAAEAGLSVAAVAFTAPGASPTGPLHGVHSVDLDADGALARLSASLGLPVWAEEDVVALTTFEQWPQLEDGEDSMVLMALGPEIGFGVVADLKIVVGAHHAAGRFGHITVADDGIGCPVGHRGCLWSTSSTGAIVGAVPGASTVQDVADAAAAGDDRAVAVLRRAARGAGVAAGHTVNLLDPNLLVLTGEVSGVLRDYREFFDAGLSDTIVSGVAPGVRISSTDSVEWARAAASYAQYRTLTAAITAS